jgi:hypothetical protein
MLSEQVLDELTRNTALQQQMVVAAWPALSTESRLQVIEKVQRNDSQGTFTWLMELCIDDPAPIVRYWAARRYPFPSGVETPTPGSLASFMAPPPENEKLLREKALADSSPLVRACVTEGPWSTDDQLSRLLFARNHSHAHFIVGMNKSFDSGLTDDDTLSDCLRELLESPKVQQELQYNGEYAEGDTAYYQGELLDAGWSLVRKAGPKVRSQLAWVLPTYRGLGHIWAEDLVTLPDDVLSSLAFRPQKTKEIVKALNLIVSSPEKFTESVVRYAKEGLWREGNPECKTAQDYAEKQLAQSEVTQELVKSLQAQVQELTEQLTALRQLAGAKKGWFS